MNTWTSNRFVRSAIAAAVVVVASAALAEDLTFNGNGTVRILASDWAAYVGGVSTFNGGANDAGRLYWRNDANAGDGQYIHFDLSRLQGLTMQSTANVTLQNTNATWGGSVTNSFIATANGAWTAASGAAVPGATAISDATNATGSYGSGTSISWGIGSSAFQSYVNNASSFNGLAIIGGSGSQMHFDGPMNPYLTVTTDAAMNGVVTVSGGAAWNSNNYSFTNGVLTLNDAVVGNNFGAGNVTINALGTVFANGNYNKYWAVDSTRINTGGVLLGYGHSHLRNLTLAGGELAGIRPDGQYGTWMFDDATAVTGGVTSTISAQQVWLNNGNFTIDAGSTLNFTGSVTSGVITPTIGAGGRLVYGAAAGSATTLGAVTLNGGELAATSTPSSVLGNYVLSDTVTVGGSSMSTISADVRVINNEFRTFNVANVDGGSAVDLLVSGKLGHYNGVSGGSFTKAGAGTMKMTGAVEVWQGQVNEGRLILEDAAIEGWWDGGLVNNAAVEFSASGSKAFVDGISGSGSLTKTGAGTLTLSGSNSYSGGTTITAGVVTAGNSNAFGPDDAAITVSNGAGIDVNNQRLAYNPTINGQINDTTGAIFTTGDLWNSGPAAITLGSNASIGSNGGRFDIGRAGGRVSQGNGYVLTKVGNNTVAVQASGSGFAGIVINGGSLVLENNDAFGTAPITINNGGTLGSWGGRTLSNAININAGGVLLQGEGFNDTYSGVVTLTGAATVNTANGNITLSGPAGGTGSLTKTGGGALTMSGGKNYSGGTTINAGTLNAVRGSLGTSGAVVVNNGGVLVANDQWVFSSTNPYGVNAGNTSSLTVNAGGEFRLDSTQGYANGISDLYLNGGSVTGGNNDIGYGALYLFNGNQRITAGGSASSTIDVSLGLTGNNNTITVDGGSTLTVSKVIRGTNWFGTDERGGFVKAGNGTLTLSGANTYSGVTDITAGTLVATSNTALGTGGHNSDTMSYIRDGATLALQGGVSLDEHFHVWGSGVGGLGAVRSISGNNALTNSPSGGAGFALRANTTVGVDADTLTVSGFYQEGGSYGLTKVGAGTLQLTAESTYAGGTVVNAGKLLLPGNGGRGRISGALTVNVGATLETTGDGTGLGFQGQISSVVVNGGVLKATDSDGHIWNISGGVTMTGGELQTNNGVSAANGHAFQWTNTQLNTNASSSSAVISGRLNLRTDNGSWFVANVADGDAAEDLQMTAAVTGGGGIDKRGAGKMVLSGNNSYSGGTTLSAGQLVAGNAAAFGSGGVSVGSGATLDLAGYAVANTITNNGGSVVNASSYTGTQSVVGATSLTGTVGGNVTVDAGGTLKGSNTTFTGAVAIANGGVHSPGNSPGTQTFASGLSYSGSSSLTWELVANTTSGPGTNYDFLSVTGGDLTINSGALLSLEFLNTGSTASAVNWNDSFWSSSQSWTIIDFTSSGTSTGNFTLVGSPSTWLDSGSTSLALARPDASFSVANQGGDVVLTYAIVPEPSSIALVGLGGLLAAAALRRRRA